MFSLGVVSSFLLVSTALASTYGSGNYGACAYSTGCPPSAGTQSTSTSTTTGGGSTTSQGQTILLNDFSDYFGNGKQLTLSVGDVIYFNVDNNGVTEKLSITVKEVGSDYAILTIGPPSFDVRFKIGDIKQFDVTTDGSNDIEITLNSIANKKATMTFRGLVKGAQTSISAPTITAATPHHSRWLLILSLLALGIGLFWLLWLLARRRRHQQGPPTPPMPPSSNPPSVGSSDVNPPNPTIVGQL